MNNISEQTNKYKKIHGMLSDKDCFIVGSGPSLLNFDFSLLDDKFTIGINHIVEHYDNLNCLLFADRIFLKTTSYNLNKFDGMLFMSEKTTWEDDSLSKQDNAYVFTDNRTGLSKNLETQGLYHPTNSGIMAMNLALLMNAKKIYLLGFDYKYRGDKMHFFEDKEHHKRYPEHKFIKKIDKMLPFVEYKDKFVNLNPDSNLNLFKKHHYKEVL